MRFKKTSFSVVFKGCRMYVTETSARDSITPKNKLKLLRDSEAYSAGNAAKAR